MNTASKGEMKMGEIVIAQIYVNGVTAVASRLKQIPKGIIGATIQVTFGSDWFGLSKTAVFQGVVTKDVVGVDDIITIPAECVEESGHRLRVGFYGVADDGTVVIPTIWTELGTIQDAADPSGDTSTDPTLPVWAQLQTQIVNLTDDLQQQIDNLIETVRMSAQRIAEVNLLAAKWVGEQSPYSQIVSIAGITPYSQVDLTPSVEQLAIFHDKDLAFVTENEDGVVTVYAIGDKPQNDYTMQVTIKEVRV